MKKVLNLDFCTSVWDGGAQYGIKFFVAQESGSQIYADLYKSIYTDLRKSVAKI